MTDIYPIARPKILTAIDVASAWNVRIQFSVSTQYDTDIDVAISAGTYFMAWDGQSDDFMLEFNVNLEAAIKAEASMGGGGTWTGWEATAYLDSDNKVKIAFDGDNYDSTAAAPGSRHDVKILWNTNGSEVGDVFGFDTRADATYVNVDNPVADADRQHAYGWYASEDGQLKSLGIEDSEHLSALQSIAGNGKVITHRYGGNYTNELTLDFIERELMWSNGVSYEGAPVYPYSANVPLECWWRAVRDGTQFRVYRDGQINTGRAVDGGVATGVSATSITDSSKSWQDDAATGYPADRWQKRIIYQAARTSNNLTIPFRRYIDTNTPTVINWSTGLPDNLGPSTTAYHLMEQTYGTYVLDTAKMKAFEPDEIPAIDRFSISIPLRRYVA